MHQALTTVPGCSAGRPRRASRIPSGRSMTPWSMPRCRSSTATSRAGRVPAAHRLPAGRSLHDPAVRHRHGRRGLALQAAPPQDRLPGQVPHHRHRPEGTGAAQAVLHPEHRRLPVLPARAVEEHPRRAVREPQDAALSRRTWGATPTKRATSPEGGPAEKYDRAELRPGHRPRVRPGLPAAGSTGQREGEITREWWGRLDAKEQAEVKAWRKAHRWHPNQLRHRSPREVRKKDGLGGRQVLLGHSRADVTQVYAERNETGRAVAAKIG